MSFRKAALVAAGLAIALSAPPSSAWHVVVPIVAKVVAPAAVPPSSGAATIAGGSAASSGAAIVGGGFVVLTGAIVWCANHQPKRNMRRDIWVDRRHDVYPVHNPRADGCLFKRQQKPIAVRW